MASNNPYSRGYGAIWEAFTNWPAWNAIVRSGQSVRQNEQAPGWQPPMPNQSMPGDRSQVRLDQRRMGIRPLKANSTAIEFRCLYTLQLATGKYGPDAMNLLIVESTRALMAIDTQNNLLGIGDILKDWEITEISAVALDPMSKRPEWTAITGILLNFAMRRSAFMQATFT